MKLRCTLLFVAVLALSRDCSLGAEPTTKTPFELLNRHATVPEAEAVWKQVVAADTAFRENLEKLAQDASPDPRKVSQGSVNLRQLKRWVEWLRHYGEPASVDLSMRLSFYDQTLLKVTQQFWSMPQSGAIRQKVVVGLARNEKQRLQRVAKITDLMQKGDPVAAEKQLDNLLDEIFATAGCLTPEEVRPITEPINKIEGFVRSAMSEVRENRTREVFAQEIQRQTEQYQALVAALEAAVGQVTSGTPLVRGEATVSDMDALRGFISDWNTAHVGLIRSVALSRAHGGQEKWTDVATRLSSSMREGFIKFVTACISKATPDQALSLYTELLPILGDLQVRCGDEALAQKLQKATLQLATKANQREQVVAYHEATSDLLRWRARAAAAKAKAKSKEFPLASSFAKEKLSGTDQVVGLYPQNQLPLPSVTRPIPDLMPLIAKSMLESSVSLPGARRLDGKSEIWMSGFTENIYGKIVSTNIRPKSIESLERDLQIDQQHPPLTLDAALAVALSRVGDYESVGGIINEVTLEGAVSRFAKFPVAAGCLIPLGEIQLGRDSLSDLVLRLDVEPKWLQHKYFFEQF